MQAELEDIAEKALKLPKNDRASLAELLLESLDYEEDIPISHEWRSEIDRRVNEIDAGEVDLVSSEEVMEKLRKKYP